MELLWVVDAQRARGARSRDPLIMKSRQYWMVEMQFSAILFWRLLLMSVRLPDYMVGTVSPFLSNSLKNFSGGPPGARNYTRFVLIGYFMKWRYFYMQQISFGHRWA